MALGQGGGCFPTALALSFWEGFYSPVSVTVQRCQNASYRTDRHAGVVKLFPCWGSCDSEQWCRMVAGPEAREDQGQLTQPAPMKRHLCWVTTSLLAARVFPTEK